MALSAQGSPALQKNYFLVSDIPEGTEAAAHSAAAHDGVAALKRGANDYVSLSHLPFLC